MGFGDGFATGVSAARGIVGTYYDVKDNQYKQQVQADNLDQIAQAKAERDYAQSERNIIASAAQSDPNAPPAPSVPPPATAPADFAQSSIQPIGADAAPADDSTAAVAAPVAPANVAVRALGQPVAPIDPNAAPADAPVPPQGAARSASIALDPTAYSSQFGDMSSSLSAAPAAAPGTAPAPGSPTPTAPPSDTRPLWRQQVDGYEAGAKFAAQSGRMGRAAELVQEAQATRVRAAGQQAETGLRQFMTGGDPSGLIEAFNTIDDGVKATSIVPLSNGAIQLNMTNAKGQPQQMITTKDQLPQLVTQYFDPQAAYQRSLSVAADRAKATFATNEDIRKETAKSGAERVNRAPTIQMQKNSDGSESPILIQPTDSGYAVGDMTGGAPKAPTLAPQDEKMHASIAKSAYDGLTNTMSLMSPDDKAKVDGRVAQAQYLYDANKDNPAIGAMNESHWLAMADSMAAGKTKNVTVQDANGNTRTAVNYNGTLYATNTIPYASPANANRPANVAPVLPKGSPYTPGTPAASSAAGARSPAAAAFAADPTVARSSTPAAAQARQTDRVTVLQQEVGEQQAAVANATTPEAKARAQGDLAAVTSELARVGGAMASARTAPVNAAPIVVPPAAAARTVNPSTGVPPPAATAARVTPATPAAASQASATGTIATPASSSAEITRDTARLAAVNASLATQARGVVSGQRPGLDQSLVAERDALQAKLNGTSLATENADRAARSAKMAAAARAAAARGSIPLGSVALR